MPAFWQIGQSQDAFIKLNHLLQADEHYLALIPISSVAAVELPTATFIIIVVVIVIFMQNVCDPITTFKYALVR